MGEFSEIKDWKDARGMQLAARVDKFLLVGTIGFACGVPGLWVLKWWVGLPLAAAWWGAVTTALAVSFMYGEVFSPDEAGMAVLIQRFLFFSLFTTPSVLLAWGVMHALLPGGWWMPAMLLGTSAAVLLNFLLRVLLRLYSL